MRQSLTPGTGTVNNDDAEPAISINDVAVTEGNAGTRAAATLSLSNPSYQFITVNYDGGQHGDGRQRLCSQSDTVTFAPDRPPNYSV